MSNRAAPKAPSGLPRRRVLIVDDDPILCEVMAEQFGAQGFDVVFAENGEVACDKIAGEHFDLAIIDLGMPKLDGFALLRHVRQHPRSVDLPVIVVTASGDKTSIDKAYQLGASSFVTKPVIWAQFTPHALFVMRNGQIERELRAAQMEAATAVRLKNGLFQVLGHELKTPLTALIGLTEVLSASLKDRVHAGEAEQLGHVAVAAQRLNLIISDVLILSKALAGRSRLNIASSPLHEILDDSLLRLKAAARALNISLLVRQPDPDLVISCDANLVRQALHKLIDNAIKFSPRGGVVEIWAHRKDDGSTVFSVRDTGPGLSPAKLKECLQPFVQEDMSYSRRVEGLGLGLPIAKAIAEAHGGELIIQTSPGQGMIAALWLPPRTPAIEAMRA